MQCAPLSEWFLVFFQTLGFSLAQQQPPKLKLRRDYMWFGGVLVFSYIVVVLLSSILYQCLVMSRYEPEIDTAEQLAKSNLKILVLKGEHIWPNQWSVKLKKIYIYTRHTYITFCFNFSEYCNELYEKIVYTDIRNIGTKIYLEMDTRYAYVMMESQAEYFIMAINQIYMNDGPIFRLMKEPICTTSF